MVSQKGYDRLLAANKIHNSNLGALKLEKKLIFFSAISPKSYIYIDSDNKCEIKFKGIGSLEQLNKEEKLKMWLDLLINGEYAFMKKQSYRYNGYVQIKEI